MAKRPAAGRCVHCLEFHEELTWDHVFPKAWYPDTTPEDMEKWKVPCCDACNKNHGKNEAELLVRFGLCIPPNQPSNMGIVDKALRALNPEVGRTPEDATARGLKRARILSQTMTGSNIPRQAIYPGFGPLSTQPEADQVVITISAKGLRQLTEKVIRGLTYLEEGRFIEGSHEIENFVVNEVGASEFRAALDRFGTTHERPPGLRIRRAVIPEDRVSAMFEIEVWGQLRLYGTVMPTRSEADAQPCASAERPEPSSAPVAPAELWP